MPQRLRRHEWRRHRLLLVLRHRLVRFVLLQQCIWRVELVDELGFVRVFVQHERHFGFSV